MVFEKSSALLQEQNERLLNVFFIWRVLLVSIKTENFVNLYTDPHYKKEPCTGEAASHFILYNKLSYARILIGSHL